MVATLLLALTIQVKLAGPGITPVDPEEYVAWVLAGEAGGMRSEEALKAMAVAARTYARANLGRHKAEGYDFCETTHCQDARPAAVTARIRAAVEETEGVILWSNGRPASVFYTGNCGGHTAGAGEIWPGAGRSYLPSQEDRFCVRNSWTARIAWTDLARVLGLPGLQRMQVRTRSASGRVQVLRTNRGLVDAEQLHLAVGRSLGWNLLRSRSYDLQESEQYALFRGYGKGHGVGLCQDGAERMGQSWQKILAFYFPGTRASVTATDIPWRILRGERVDVWSAGLPGDEALPGKADRALREIEQATGLTIHKRPVIRVYPTVSVYRDTTGESGRIAAVTRGRVVHMQPRATGSLRHELVHVVLGLNSSRPLAPWLDEGLADYLSGGPHRPKLEALVKEHGLGWVIGHREELGVP